jgi:hypothetical protein
MKINREHVGKQLGHKVEWRARRQGNKACAHCMMKVGDATCARCPLQTTLHLYYTTLWSQENEIHGTFQ